MNKIANWVFGSFFRTIGRLLVFVLLGFVIAHFIDFSDIISNFRITDLFFEKVDALSLDGNYNGLTQIRDTGGVINITNNQLSDYVPFTYEYTNNNGHEYIAFPYSGYYGVDQQIDIDSTNFNTFVSKFSLVITLYSRTGYGSYNTQCEMQNNFIVCPMYRDGQYYRLDFLAFGGNLNSQTELNIHLNISAFPIIYDTDTSSIVNAQEQTTDAITNQTQQQQQQHSEMMNDTVQDSNETESAFESFESFLPENGIITQLITLPITLYTNILNSVNASCSAFSLGNIFGKPLTLPCINISNYLGSNLWGVIDILMSGFFVLVIARKLIKVFNSMSSMKEGDVLGD